MEKYKEQRLLENEKEEQQVSAQKKVQIGEKNWNSTTSDSRELQPLRQSVARARRASRLGTRNSLDGEENIPEDKPKKTAPVPNYRQRRSSLLGNLTASGRHSRGFSLGHLSLHLTKDQREKKDDEFALPPEDYYLMEEHDELGILLEKPDQLPGLFYIDPIQQNLISTTEKKPPCTAEGSGFQKPLGEAAEEDVLKSEEKVIGEESRKSEVKAEIDESRKSEVKAEIDESRKPETEQRCEKEVEIPADYVFPVQRNAVEQSTKLEVLRNLRSYLQNHDKSVHKAKCYYGEDEVDLSFLTAKPITFIIIGKPGIGKSTLGAKLAEKMHSVHLNPENVIEYFRGPREPINSVRVNEKLENGESISDGVVIELLLKRIREFDVLHRGYVLEGFPMVTSDDQPVQQQLEILSRLTLLPDYLIIMQMQDKDLYKRRINQKLDPGTGKVYTSLQYSKFDPDELVFDRRYSLQPNTMTDSMLRGDQKITDNQQLQNSEQHKSNPSRFSGVSSSEVPATEDQSDTVRRTADNGRKHSGASSAENGDILVNEVDFPKLPAQVLDRLFYRTEDFNIIVSDDLESFRYNAGEFQDFIHRFDKRKVMEVDAYWAPTIIFRRVWEFCESVGLQPIPVPSQITRPLSMLYYKKRLSSEDAGEEDDDESDEDDDDDDDNDDENDEEVTKGKYDASEELCEDDEQQPDIDWVSAMRAVCVRGLVDPRFRWRISRWQNLCPVALKFGRSLVGKPDLSVSFMDKVFFLSTKRAVDQFINNPRPYLLPKMPTSPVKFIVLGHPLSGKTTFAKEIAHMTDGKVIDISKEVQRRFPAVKNDFIWKKRLKYALEATHIVNRENMLRWQRQERTRRRDMHAWIENHLRSLAEEEIEAALERDREVLQKLRIEMRKVSEYHAMGEPFAGDGLCQADDAKVHFNWKKFVSEAFGGKRDWTHQELLQLAWDLFHQRRLYYKRKKQGSSDDELLKDSNTESDEELNSQMGRRSSEGSLDGSLDGEGSYSNDDFVSDLDESDDAGSKRRKKKRRNKKGKKRKCIQIEVKRVEPEDVIEPFLFESFDVDPDDPEVEESVRMRFPTIPFELVDIVPSPPLVGDLDPTVESIVKEKLENDKINLESMPTDIFVEVLKRTVSEVEIHYRKRNRHGALTGGWIIDNFPPEIEKWRAVLRTPEICPDQVFLLLDLTEGNMKIWSRFKKLYRILHPPNSQIHKEIVVGPSRVASQSNSAKKKHSDPSLLGETVADLKPATQTLFEPRPAKPVTGEDQQLEEMNDELELRAAHESNSGLDFGITDFETETEEQGASEVDEKLLELVSGSHFMLSLLPKDNLTDVVSMTSSEQLLINRDLHRNQTVAFSDIDSEEGILENIFQGHEKYILESINKEFDESDYEDDDADCSWSSVDFDEIERRKEAVLRMKATYGEMSVCVEEVDAFHHQNADGTHISNDDATTIPVTENKIKNPPGTPDTGGAAHNSDEEDGIGIKQLKVDNWGVPMPSAIAMGEVEMSPEDFELKTTLENEIKRLSQPLEEEVKTPSEMASAMTIMPETANSGEGRGGGYNTNLLYHKLLTTKFESPKRKFFAQVRMFNEFWNMALPVCNQQGVRYWEVGLCDEDTALEKSIFIWNELESRFDIKAKQIVEMELKEEDEEILESLVKWGQPFEEGDIRYRAYKNNQEDDEEEDDDDEIADSELDDDEDNGDNEDNDSTTQSDSGRDQDELLFLENKPDLYWKALRRREAERCFGDYKYYCPVTLADFKVLRKGSPKYACKFRDRLYYCNSMDARLRFFTNPRQFISNSGPSSPPPPRICITGSPGCRQEEIANELCTEFKVCYVNFRQRLHEIIHARYEREVGPEKQMKIVSVEDTKRALAESKSGDDLFLRGGENGDDGADHSNINVKFSIHQIPVATAVKENVLGMINIPSQEILGKNEQRSIHKTALISLGLIDQYKVETIPLNTFQRTERLTHRKWEKLTRIEAHVKAFLENGIQLPDDVLDYFILPLWHDKPFTQTGFILVGFPNTYDDVQYMLSKNLFPEHVFVMDCKSVVIRNRLIVPTVDRWHREQNPSGKKQKRLSMNSQRSKMRLEGIIPPEDKTEVFPYQLEGRLEPSEFESETWKYNDAVARDISRALRYYHSIYSRDLDKMKKILNKERIDWTPMETNTGLYQAKHKVIDSVAPMLKYRNNVFEDTVRLTFSAAQALLDRGVFTLSPLKRWCPVEISKGNTGINLWNAPGVQKIPYLYRRFIYFVAGEKNAKLFEQNTLELTNQLLIEQPPPLVCMVLGMPKSGKTTLAKNIANRLGLQYISLLEAVESVLTHEFATEWAHILYELNPALASSGHQPMRLSKELMEYVREGRAIPRFLVYRCLDLALMNPKAQCSGVVFDDFPTLSDELIELNYREMTPCTVLRTKIPITEAYDRCDRNRDPLLSSEEIPEDSRECIDYLWDQYGNETRDTLYWFSDEYQNVNLIDGTESPEMVFRKATEICMESQRKIQQYIRNHLEGKPNTLEGTCPITSRLFNRLTPDFGFFCPVALNDSDELVSVKQIADLSQVVEYKGQVFLFSSKNAVRKFLNHPKRYTMPGCMRTPPKDLPQTLVVKPEDFERLQQHWGFMDFDPVLYYANHHFKGLQRGDPKYCVVYRNKLYVFISVENQIKFLSKPSQYWNLLLPMKLPRKAQQINYDKVTPFSYLTAKGMVPLVRRLLKLMAEKRPRGPFMNVDQSAALYMGYYLKSQNMSSPFATRQKYRDAMFKMTTMKNSTKDFLTELQGFYGCRQRNMPERIRKQLEEFITLEHAPIEKKLLFPKIPDITLSYDAVPAPFTEEQVARKVRRMMNSLRDTEARENLDGFKSFSNKKKAAEDAAERAAQDARDAAELALKIQQRSQKRISRAARSRGRNSDSNRTEETMISSKIGFY